MPVSLCYILSMACSFFGIRFIEESLADPIENTAGAMCSLLCVIFLGEKIAPMVWVAIGIILIGIIGVTKTESSADVNRKQKLGKKLAVIAFAMPFCYAIIDALGSFLDIFFLEMETSPLIGITEENIELVLIVRHQIHQQIGNQQHQPLIPPGHQRDPRQRTQGHANKRKLFFIHALKECFHGAKQNRLDDRYQRR